MKKPKDKSNSNPIAAGWQEFFDFTWGYNFLPDALNRSFKSHYLIVQFPRPRWDL